jgi:hypothetical protein
MLLVITSITIYILVIRPKGFGIINGKVDFKVINKIEYDPLDKVDIQQLDKNIIKSSKDGVTMENLNGTAIWDKTFNMMNPKVIKESKYLAVGDISGKEVYLFNKEGFVRRYNVNYPILMYDINEKGIVVIIQQSVKGHIIEIFDDGGKRIVHRETVLESDGYPLAFDISKDGTKVVTSYLFVKGNSITSNLTFFNFSETGQRFEEKVTGGYSIDGTIIPQLKILDNKHVCAIGDNQILFYKLDVVPEEINQIELTNEIKMVNYTDNKLLILFGKTTKNDESYKDNSLVIYSNIGKVLSNTEFDDNITYLSGNMDKYYVESDLFIREYCNGKINWKATIKEDIKKIMPFGKNTFIIVLQDEYRIIKIVK